MYIFCTKSTKKYLKINVGLTNGRYVIFKYKILAKITNSANYWHSGITKEFEIPVAWGIIAGKTYGDPKNFPVLCTHGFWDNCNSFDGLIPYLPKGNKMLHVFVKNYKIE